MGSGKDDDLKYNDFSTRFAEVEKRVAAIVSENAELRERVAELERELAQTKRQGEELESFQGKQLRIREKIERVLQTLEAIGEKE